MVEAKWWSIADSVSVTEDYVPPPPTKDGKPVKLTRAEIFIARLHEARKVWPKIFVDEKEFWAAHPDNATTAPFPEGFDTEGFVKVPGRLNGPVLSSEGAWLLRALDGRLPPSDPRPAAIGEALSKAIDALWDDEDAGSAVGGCKHGRPLINLALHSSKHLPPMSRDEYDPKSDLQVGECAVVLMDKELTPGERGWDLVLVNSVRVDNEISKSYNVSKGFS